MAQHILERHPIPAAGLLAIATIPFHLALPQQASELLAAGILALIGGIYIGFAVVDGRISRIALETFVAVLFAVFAMTLLALAPVWLAADYIAHGIWDAAHHSPLFDTHFPRWYIPACAVYDVIVGLALFLIWM